MYFDVYIYTYEVGVYASICNFHRNENYYPLTDTDTYMSAFVRSHPAPPGLLLAYHDAHFQRQPPASPRVSGPAAAVRLLL